MKDIKIVNNELSLLNGDFMAAESDQQHIEDIIGSFIGEWKEFPYIGVGVEDYINSTGEEQELARQIKLQLQADGYSAENAKIKRDQHGNLIIEPNAVRN